MTFTLTADLNEIDGRPSSTTDLVITPMTEGGASITDATAKKIYDGYPVPLAGGILVDRDGKTGVQLPDKTVFFWVDDDGVQHPGSYLVTRPYADGTREWVVPAQDPDAKVDLTAFAGSVDPVPVPPSFVAQVKAVQAGLTAEGAARSTGDVAVQQAAAADASTKAAAAQAAAVAAAATDATTKANAAQAAATSAASTALAAALPTKADLVGGKLPTSQLPDLAVVDYLGTSANQAAMLAKVGQKGDWTIRQDAGTVWIITGTDPTQLASWTQVAYPAAPVASVAGKTGAVTLAAADVGAAPASEVADRQADTATKAPLASAALTGTPKVNGVPVATTVVNYSALARNPDLLISGALTRDANGTLTTAPVTWPDGTPGTFTTLVINPSSYAIDSYKITYGSPAVRTYTQPTITRDSNGTPTVVPAITVA